MYKLKSESFTMVEGPYAGKQFKRGDVYETVPPSEMRRFEEIKNEPARALDSSPAPDTETDVDEEIKPKAAKNRQYGK